jgi:hypothetical protein
MVTSKKDGGYDGVEPFSRNSLMARFRFRQKSSATSWS